MRFCWRLGIRELTALDAGLRRGLLHRSCDHGFVLGVQLRVRRGYLGIESIHAWRYFRSATIVTQRVRRVLRAQLEVRERHEQSGIAGIPTDRIIAGILIPARQALGSAALERRGRRTGGDRRWPDRRQCDGQKQRTRHHGLSSRTTRMPMLVAR